MKLWSFDIALPSAPCNASGALNFIPQQACSVLEPPYVPREYSATRQRINCRGLARYSFHHCLCWVPVHTWVEWECTVNPGGLMKVYTIPSHYCPYMRSRFRDQHIGAVQHWMANSVSTEATYPSTDHAHHDVTLSMLQSWCLCT